ncbi:MAG: T9SS type A sorting domain-containing protein [Bacteroidota bacterium]
MKSLMLVLSLVVSTAFANTNPTVQLTRSEYQNQNILTLKVDKELLGATFQMLDSDGQVVSTNELTKKKRTIDFTDMQNDEYVVRITKDNFTRVFKIFKDIETGVLCENYY